MATITLPCQLIPISRTPERRHSPLGGRGDAGHAAHTAVHGLDGPGDNALGAASIGGTVQRLLKHDGRVVDRRR
jgi:hypothetical protein